MRDEDPTTNDCLIEVQDVSKRFGSLTAVDGVSFRVRAGECFGLLGPNGAGKTTLLRMLYCVSSRTSGELRIFGLDPQRHPAVIKHRIGVVAQTDNLDDELTVAQNLEVYAGYFGLSRRDVRDRVSELMAFMSLEGREGDPIRELSGGLKRRLVIARALINAPDLVILDEPTTGLDPQARHVVWARLRALRDRGVTLLLTTHYMEEAHQLCDRLVIVDHGRVLAEGRPRELVAERLPPHVLELSDRDLPAELPVGTDLERHGDRVFIYSRSPDALEQVAVHAAAEYRIRSTTLEDLFLRLTGRELRESD